MIRHRLLGSGHPYVPDTGQCWPVPPVVGQMLNLGVRASGDVLGVTVELDVGGGRRRFVALRPVPRSSRGRVGGGHLASAQARRAGDAGGWLVEVPVEAVGLLRYRFAARKGDGGMSESVWYSVRAAAWTPAGPDVLAVDGAAGRIVGGSVEVLDDGERVRRVRFALALSARERVVGFGERFDRLDQRGVMLDSQVFEQYKNQGLYGRTYLPMPFAHVVGGGGWGFHVRTSRRVWFDVTSPDRIVIEAEVDAPSGASGVLSVGFYGGAPHEVVSAFWDEVGWPKELPNWVFRLWASGNEWNTQAEVERQIGLHKEHGIPVGNVVIEAWSDESTFTVFRDARYDVRADGGPMGLADFTFPPDGAWPDPKGMVDRLHSEGVRVHLWQIPLIKMRPHPTGQARADADAAIRGRRLVQEVAPDGELRPYRNRGWWFPLALMPDLSDADAADWWTSKRRYLVDEVGVDGFKTDGGEHAWGSDLVYLDGTRGDEGNNRYPVAYAAAYGRLLESCGKAPVTFSRAGFTGSQAHGVFWAGDENSTWEAFRWSMLAGLNAAACGIVYWGWDIAGFSGPIPDAELYVRAMAVSAFVPIMQYHSEFNHHRRPCRDRTPWNIAEQTGDTRVIGEVRDIVRLRERLVPYLAAQARHTITTGRPLMRPMFFDYPQDEQVWQHPIQWTLGDSMLVAPVLEPGRSSWPVYLPQGRWVDAWTSEIINGNTIVENTAPRHHAPAYIKEADWAKLQPIFTERP